RAVAGRRRSALRRRIRPWRRAAGVRRGLSRGSRRARGATRCDAARDDAGDRRTGCAHERSAASTRTASAGAPWSAQRVTAAGARGAPGGAPPPGGPRRRRRPPPPGGGGPPPGPPPPPFFGGPPPPDGFPKGPLGGPPPPPPGRPRLLVVYEPLEADALRHS